MRRAIVVDDLPPGRLGVGQTEYDKNGLAVGRFEWGGYEEIINAVETHGGRATHGIGNDKKKRIMELFLLSSRYEFLFWEMCWHGEEWPV